MEAIIERCAWIDVHERTVVVCVLKGDLKKKPEKEIETFNTTTTELLKLLDWIEERGCTQVAIESTGVYWKPVWNVLESADFEMILANARHIKDLLGRKILNKIMNQEEIRMTDLIEILNGRGKASIRKKLTEIKEVVNGKVRKHHLTMIKYSYNHVKFLEQQIIQIEE